MESLGQLRPLPVMGLTVLTPSNPLSLRRQGFTSKFIRIIQTMMSWTHVPTAGTPPHSSSHQEPRAPQETSQACMGAQS